MNERHQKTWADMLHYFLFSSVSARQTYMKGILSQSSDNQYWDIWNRQTLSPEFEVKRQNILKANQVSVSDILTNFVCLYDIRGE
jgi:nuclear pore complex protein Nup214